MTIIKAVGKYTDDKMEVICLEVDNELVFFFDRHEDFALESVFRNILKERHPIAGTFFPEEESMLNVLNVIQYHFFDEKPSSVEVEGDVGEIPFEEGVVY